MQQSRRLNQRHGSPQPRRKTLADQFCETYVVAERGCSFILMPVLLTDRVLGENRQSLLSPGARVDWLTEKDGVPAFRVRTKFHRSLRQHRDNARALFNALNYIFTESAIKRLFTMPNIWLANHNEQARKRNATEESALNHLKKVDPAGFALHAQCAARTRNTSVSIAARKERQLSVAQ